jgi:hypothetical protein
VIHIVFVIVVRVKSVSSHIGCVTRYEEVSCEAFNFFRCVSHIAERYSLLDALSLLLPSVPTDSVGCSVGYLTTLSVAQAVCTAPNVWMIVNDYLERIWKEASCSNLR